MIRALALVAGLALLAPLAAFAQVEVERAPGTGEGHAEVLTDETTFRVDGSRARLSRKITVRVDGPEGRDHGLMVLGYDSFRRVRSLRGEIRDADGRRVQRLRRGDIQDRPGSDGFSLYSDYRRQVAELYHHTYPYFLEWQYEVDYETLLIWPTWYPQRGRDRVQQATLTVDIPADFAVRYRAQWLDADPVEAASRGRRTLTWNVSLPRQPQEPLGPSRRDQVAAVHFAADRFEIERWPGSLATWQDFGTWYGSLWNGHGDLPAAAREEVRRLVEGVDEPRERARLVYQFVQRRTRYVSVQLGIGGWKPFDAEYVHTRQYGDCKALTNYLQALLREVGIESFPALIGADRPDLDANFPYNGFNHVILFVPLGNEEPVWLEATSQHLPFGKLAPATEDRFALVVTPQGGQLHRTGVSPAAANLEDRIVHAELHPDGTVNMQVTTAYDGHAIASLRALLARTTSDERERFWTDLFGLPRVTVHRTNADGLDITADGLSLSVDLSVNSYASQAGRRMFLNPNLTRREIRVPPPVRERRQPVEAFRYGFVDIDTVRIALPAGAVVEVPIDDVRLEEEFGSYSASMEVDGDAVIYMRRLAIYEPRRPAEDYDRIRTFLETVHRADSRQLALLVEN